MAQTTPEGVDRRHNLPNARVTRWARDEVAGTGRPASPQLTHCFEALQKALPCLGPLQSTAAAQSVAHGHMAAFDGLGRVPDGPMQPGSDVSGAWAGG